MCLSANIAGIIILINNFSKNWGYNLIVTKILITLFFVIVLILVVEPEKIKFVLYLITIIMISIIFIIDFHSIKKISNETTEKSYTYANLANMGVFLGISSYAFESVGSIFTVRRTMKNRKTMPRITTWTYVFIALTYYLTGLIIYLVSFFYLNIFIGIWK